jgi:hypothetical protein
MVELNFSHIKPNRVLKQLTVLEQRTSVGLSGYGHTDNQAQHMNQGLKIRWGEKNQT